MKDIEIQGKNYTEAEAMAMALKYHKEKDFYKAERIYRKIYLANPRNADALHFSALILYHFGDFNSALFFLNRAIKLNEAVPEFYYNKGIVELEINNFKEAKLCFQKALELNPNYNKAQEAIRKYVT
ncbi:MAG: tetratricopeptide repeat protein [Patescibacteria group bacterium]